MSWETAFRKKKNEFRFSAATYLRTTAYSFRFHTCRATRRPERRGTYVGTGHGGDQLLGGASSQGVAFPLRAEQPQLLSLLVRQAPAVPHLVVVRRQLLQQLPHPVPFACRVQVWHLVLGYAREERMYLEETREKKLIKRTQGFRLNIHFYAGPKVAL